MSIIWSEDFLTGITLIDDQHRLLVDAINTLHVAATNAEPVVQNVSDLLFDVLEHAINNFITEEEMLQRLDFPGYQTHKSHNDAFNHKAQFIIQELGEGNTLANDTLMYLNHWLVEHIQLQNKAYVGFLIQNGVK